MLINREGEAFMHPLETRDVSAASIIRECQGRGKGVQTPDGQGVWLDTPMIELRNGAGTIERRIPAMLRMFGKYGMDIRKTPILVYPTLHYQNGGPGHRPGLQTPGRAQPLCSRRGGGRHPRQKPAHGQQPPGHHRLWPGRRAERPGKRPGRRIWVAPLCVM